MQFRYFNAAGAPPSGLLGEDHNPEGQLIPLVLQTALGLREVIEAVQQGTGRPIPVIEADRRAGDSSALVGSSQKARHTLGWNPKYGDIDTILAHAWQWHQRRHGAPVP